MINSSPFTHKSINLPFFMGAVAITLIPALFTYIWFFGPGIAVHMLIGITTALATETIMLKLRHRPVKPFIADNSAIITAVLLVFCIPPFAPWWISFIGVAFAIVFGKHLYGGLGYNPFNPAMLGYAMLLISFPAEMTAWTAPVELLENAPGLISTLQIIFYGSLLEPVLFDAITMATPLDALKTQLGLEQNLQTILQGPVFGVMAGKGWEWINVAILAGGLFLMFKKIITWHIPVALLGSLLIMSGIFYIIDPQTYVSPFIHLFSGAAMLGAFYIATDPVTASTTVKGRLLFGAGIGVLTYIIRTWGGYPDGIAFAVLLMNMTTPLIDYYTQTRVFGHNGEDS
ncbi:MAG: electron transport complex subunit RsxD [Gammaproteobacteria bacterium]|nr:electron transport complex subunit RsxD [Gammaproteobacteria bacterium]MDH5614157.1 electron transport complex subunit RsxD [Gammaproteobacteria bacterium]